MVTKCVFFCAVATESLNYISINFFLQRLRQTFFCGLILYLQSCVQKISLIRFIKLGLTELKVKTTKCNWHPVWVLRSKTYYIVLHKNKLFISDTLLYYERVDVKRFGNLNCMYETILILPLCNETDSENLSSFQCPSRGFMLHCFSSQGKKPA